MKSNNDLTTALKSCWRVMTPPPDFTVSEWADAERYLSRESSANPGKYRTAFAPYQRAVMDAVNDPSVQRLVVMFASQTGKTEMVNNIAGYFIDCDPAPILVVQPTIEFAESWSKERLVPMLRDSPCFAGKIRDARSRDSGNTILHKSFVGGNIAIVGANAPSGLAGRPRRVVLLDEVDRFPASAGTEGDPCALAIRRTESFHNAVVVMTSTPTIKGVSAIEKEFLESDQQKLFCPCPHCGEHQVLTWAHVVWPEGKPEEAFIKCEKCQASIDDQQRVKMVRAGQWRPTAPFGGKRGYFLNGICSPFKHKRGFKNRLHQMVVEFLEAWHGGDEKHKTWVNTFLSETWEAMGATINPDDIGARREDYATEVPAGVLVLTWAADVQGDRIEAEIVGWGEGEECWGIRRGYFVGDPNTSPHAWQQLRDFAETELTHPLYGKIKPTIGVVDSGFATQAAYQFVRKMMPARVYAVKGAKNRLKHPVETPRRGGRSSALLVDTQEFKSIIYSRLKNDKPGPRYYHFPKSYDDEFFAQLTAEKVVTKHAKGIASQSWENTRSNRRNEALDIRVYSHAALHILNVNWEKLKENMGKRGEVKEYVLKPAEPQTTEQVAEHPAARPVRAPFVPRRPGGGWVGGFR